MRKQAVSVTLGAENLLWLRGQMRARGRRSVSELLDGLVTEARTGGKPTEFRPRSMVGRVRIAESDPDLATADAAIHALFQASLGRKVGARRTRGSVRMPRLAPRPTKRG